MIIVYCLDENYKDITEISIQSVKKFNPRAHVVVVSEQPIGVRGADEYHIIKLPKVFRNKGVGDRITNTAYLKCFLTELPYDKILYIDGDIVCQAPLNELWNTKCQYICMCESHNFGLQQAQVLGVEKYCNSGMMLMNLKNLRDINFTDKCLEVERTFNKEPKWFQHDETCINLSMQGKITFVDKKWNYCRNRNYNEPIREEDACLLHHIGRHKDDMVLQYRGMDRLLKDIKGKSVAIVGNAKSIFDKRNGSEIDAHEFIVRFNNGFTERPECQGCKTSMLMLALNMPLEKLKLYNSKWVVNRSNRYDNRVDYIIPNIDRQKMRDRLDAQPSTGFMAIDLCLCAQAGSIDLYGFDGEKTPTFYNPEGYVTQHKYDKEQEIIQEYAKNKLLTIY